MMKAGDVHDLSTALMDQCNNISDKLATLDAKKEEMRRYSLSVMKTAGGGGQVGGSTAPVVSDNPRGEGVGDETGEGGGLNRDDVLKFNVGGKCVDIHRATLMGVRSRLSWMMNGRWDHCLPRDRSGRLFLDFDYEWIEPVFLYLRDLAEGEGGPSGEYPQFSGSTGQTEVIRWLEMEFVLHGTPPPGKTVSSSLRGDKVWIDDVVAALEVLKNDLDDEVAFMSELTERLGQEDRQALLHFSVGGTPVTVSKNTLRQARDSKLWAHYCSGRWEVQDQELDQDGLIVLDMDPGCFGKIISCLRLTALAKDRGCDVRTWPRGVMIEGLQRHYFARMVSYLQIEEVVFDGILEIEGKGVPLCETIRISSDQLTEWVGTKPHTWKLLYRGSRDGFSAAAFHAACDGVTPTVTIVQDNNNSVFGGYSSISWAGNDGAKVVPSPGAFVFSLSRSGVVDLTTAKKCPFKNGAVAYRNPGHGPVWGGVKYFNIADNCDKVARPSGFLHGNMFANYGDAHFLTGGAEKGEQYLVQELEVYAS